MKKVPSRFHAKNILHYFNALKTPYGMHVGEHSLFKWYHNALHAIHPIMQSMIESYSTFFNLSYPKYVLWAYFVKFVFTKSDQTEVSLGKSGHVETPLLYPPTHPHIRARCKEKRMIYSPHTKLTSANNNLVSVLHLLRSTVSDKIVGTICLFTLHTDSHGKTFL